MSRRTAQDWEEIWQCGVNPGDYFDMKGPAPALLAELSADWMPRGEGSVLVPGMGRGYDLEAIARSDRYAKVVGVDISQLAADTAREYLASCKLSRQIWEVKCADFFAFDAEKYDLVIDYTFLCALPPDMRNQWAERMAQLVKPGGSLITLIFPIGELSDVGPPFRVNFPLFHKLLEPNGFTPVDGPRMLPDELCHPTREGKSGYARWVLS